MAQSGLDLFPYARMRRMRKDPFSRKLMQENVLTPADLMLEYSVFISFPLI